MEFSREQSEFFDGGQLTEHSGAGTSIGTFAHLFVLNVVRNAEVSQRTSRGHLQKILS